MPNSTFSIQIRYRFNAHISLVSIFNQLKTELLNKDKNVHRYAVSERDVIIGFCKKITNPSLRQSQ